ncbi:MAG: hypothetical protein RML40_01310 [Bacteroidota bacterium]|nr:hypothetical protein [Candidatus Kapabacteria bacterium]MDW8219146.1 hypothetical protein [Bacteroidota bacterium]
MHRIIIQRTRSRGILHYHTMYLISITFAVCGTMHSTAQIAIPLPPLPGMQMKSKSAAELLQEEAENSPANSTTALNDFLQYSSRGWFACPLPGVSLYAVSSAAFLINDAHNVTFPALPRINGRFSAQNPYPDNEYRRPLPPLTHGSIDTVRRGEYYDSEYDDIMLLCELELPLPLILRTGIGYAYQRAVLFAQDRTFYGLAPDHSGRLIPLREYHTLDMQEHYLQGILGFKIPFYGAFADLLDQRIGSYYYVYFGAHAQYNVFNRAVHHAQLIQPGIEFRYGTRTINVGTTGQTKRITNGTDTLQLWNAPMPSLLQWRLQPEVALGWGLNTDISILEAEFGVALLTEIFGIIPVYTVTSDTEWRQYVLGLRIAVGWHHAFRQR